MEVSYLKEGQLVRSANPLDLDIDVKTPEPNRVQVTVKAKEDVVLQEVRELAPFKPRKGQEVFFNGYQSWTDSREVPLTSKEKNITKVVFDRNGYLYHGVVKALADGTRSAGIVF